MLFFGAPIETTVHGVQLRDTTPATGWIRQGPPNQTMECRFDNGQLVACRTAGSNGVKGLQQALVALATATGDPKYDPKSVDGIIGVNTRVALANAIYKIAPTLTSALKYPALALAAAALTGQVDDQIKTAADGFSTAINVYIIKESGSTPAIDPSLMPYPGAGTPWYAQTSGKVVIGVGAAVVLLLLLRR